MRIGKFGYVNNFLPYYHLEQEGRYEIVDAPPRKMEEMMRAGGLHYAPIPSFSFLSSEDLRRYRFCVASEGEVYSVIVVSRKKRLDDAPIAVTTHSRTSINLLRIILKEKGMINKVVPVNGTATEMLKDFDHALVIGDEAIKARMLFRVVMDLGEEWKELTDLPMVFGVSASKRNFDSSQIDKDVLNSLEWGEKNIDEVVEKASIRFRLPEDFLYAYFRALIHKMGDKEEKGLREFGEMCREYGLL
jgi:chorismate dehydratase